MLFSWSALLVCACFQVKAGSNRNPGDSLHVSLEALLIRLLPPTLQSLPLLGACVCPEMLSCKKESLGKMGLLNLGGPGSLYSSDFESQFVKCNIHPGFKHLIISSRSSSSNNRILDNSSGISKCLSQIKTRITLSRKRN